MQLRVTFNPAALAAVYDDGLITLDGAAEITVTRAVHPTRAHEWLGGATVTLTDDGGVLWTVARSAVGGRAGGWTRVRAYQGRAGSIPLCRSCGNPLLPREMGSSDWRHANPKHLHRAEPMSAEGLALLTLPHATDQAQAGELTWRPYAPGQLVEDWLHFPS